MRCFNWDITEFSPLTTPNENSTEHSIQHRVEENTTTMKRKEEKKHNGKREKNTHVCLVLAISWGFTCRLLLGRVVLMGIFEGTLNNNNNNN